MNPLEIIANWIKSQTDKEVKLDLISLMSHFHANSGIELEHNVDKKIELSLRYLDGTRLTPKQVIQRTIEIKGLIDFCLDERITNEDWEKNKKRIEELIERSKENELLKDDKTMSDVLERLPSRQAIWMPWAAEWIALKNYELSHQSLFNWYYQQEKK